MRDFFGEFRLLRPRKTFGQAGKRRPVPEPSASRLPRPVNVSLHPIPFAGFLFIKAHKPDSKSCRRLAPSKGI